MTGEFEALYLLHCGVAETFISLGLDAMRGMHSAISIDDGILNGFQQDQETALEMEFAHVTDAWYLTSSAVMEEHALIAPGISRLRHSP